MVCAFWGEKEVFAFPRRRLPSKPIWILFINHEFDDKKHFGLFVALFGGFLFVDFENSPLLSATSEEKSTQKQLTNSLEIKSNRLLAERSEVKGRVGTEEKENNQHKNSFLGLVVCAFINKIAEFFLSLSMSDGRGCRAYIFVWIFF